jgi:hypothetical protein
MELEQVAGARRARGRGREAFTSLIAVGFAGYGWTGERRGVVARYYSLLLGTSRAQE